METEGLDHLALAVGLERAELATENDRLIAATCHQHLHALEVGGVEATVRAQQINEQIDLAGLLSHNARRFNQIHTQAGAWAIVAENHIPAEGPDRVTLMRCEAAAAASLAASAAAIEATVRLAARVEELRG